MADASKSEAPPSAAGKAKSRPAVPVVRQTLASKLRLLKADPLVDREKLLKENIVSRIKFIGSMTDENTTDKSSTSVFQFSATPVSVAKKSNKENHRPEWRSSIYNANKASLMKTGKRTLQYGKDCTKVGTASYSSVKKMTVSGNLKTVKPNSTLAPSVNKLMGSTNAKSVKQTTGYTSVNNQFKTQSVVPIFKVPQRNKNILDKTPASVLNYERDFAAPLDKMRNMNVMPATRIQKQSSQHNVLNNKPEKNLGAIPKNVKTVRINNTATYFQTRNSVTPVPPDKKRKSILKKSVSQPDDLNRTFEADDKSVSFINGKEAGHTPGKTSIRRSVSFISPTEKYSVPSKQTVFTPDPNVLRKNLIDWLKKRGKPATSFHHLHCFGLQESDVIKEAVKVEKKPKQILGENRTIPTCSSTYVAAECSLETNNLGQNFTDAPLDSSTPTNSPEKSISIRPTPDGAYGPVPQANSPNTSNKENETPCKNKEKCSSESLRDLLKLIKAGYSRSRCEQWLTLIQHSCPPVVETPLFWQCRALLMETLGQYFSAMSDYTTAIVKGAAPDDIGVALDQMLQKFGEIHVTEETDGKGNKYIDPANVFKSTIIQFALRMQKQSQKEGNRSHDMTNESQMVVTPVRRSTRRSASQYKETPGITVVNSLEDDKCKNVAFKPNLVLEPGSSSKRNSSLKKKL